MMPATSPGQRLDPLRERGASTFRALVAHIHMYFTRGERLSSDDQTRAGPAHLLSQRNKSTGEKRELIVNYHAPGSGDPPRACVEDARIRQDPVSLESHRESPGVGSLTADPVSYTPSLLRSAVAARVAQEGEGEGRR